MVMRRRDGRWVRFRRHFGEGQDLSVGMPGHWKLSVLAIGQALRFSGPVRALPIQVICRFVAALSCEDDTPRIVRPNWTSVQARFEGQAGRGLPLQIVSPHIKLVLQLVERDLIAVQRKPGVHISRRRRMQQLRFAAAEQPHQLPACGIARSGQINDCPAFGDRKL